MAAERFNCSDMPNAQAVVTVPLLSAYQINTLAAHNRAAVTPVGDTL